MLSFIVLLCVGRNAEPAYAGKESVVKAAFVYKFLLFTDFPEWAHTESPKEISICIYGPHGFNGAFDPVKGKLINGRLLRITTVPAQSGRQVTKHCHILFISSENSPETTKYLLSTLTGAPVLTIGEHEDFLKWGGMIRLYLDGGRIAFDVNADSAHAAGISFRAQMLRIAKQVLEAKQ